MGLTRKNRNGGGLFGNSASKLKSQMATVNKYKTVQASSKQLNANIQTTKTEYEAEKIKYMESKKKVWDLWSKLQTLKAKKLSYIPRYGFNSSASLNKTVAAQLTKLNTRKAQIRQKQAELANLLKENNVPATLGPVPPTALNALPAPEPQVNALAALAARNARIAARKEKIAAKRAKAFAATQGSYQSS